MKIKADTTDLEMSLMKAAGNIALRLKQMVQGFAYEFVLKASNQTPIGDDELYADLYNKRVTDQNWQSYGLEPQAGFAKGSWRLSLSGTPELQEYYGDGSTRMAYEKAKDDSKAYNLGQRIYVMNSGPYITILENKYGSEGGIMQFTIDNVLAAHKIDLKRYYSNPL